MCSFKGVDIALFSAGGSISKKFGPLASDLGCTVRQADACPSDTQSSILLEVLPSPAYWRRSPRLTISFGCQNAWRQPVSLSAAGQNVSATDWCWYMQQTAAVQASVPTNRLCSTDILNKERTSYMPRLPGAGVLPGWGSSCLIAAQTQRINTGWLSAAGVLPACQCYRLNKMRGSRALTPARAACCRYAASIPSPPQCCVLPGH